MRGLELVTGPSSAVAEPPPGYEKLTPGVRCRCLNLYKLGDDFYCCRAGKAHEEEQTVAADNVDVDAILRTRADRHRVALTEASKAMIEAMDAARRDGFHVNFGFPTDDKTGRSSFALGPLDRKY